MSPFFYALILLVGVFIGSISQVMLKKAALKKYDDPLKEYLNPLVIFAYVMFVGTTFLSVYAYKGIPPVLEATSYIYVTFWGVKIFGENINFKKIVAIVFILAGIACYSLV